MIARSLAACALAACAVPSAQCPDYTSAPVNGRCSYPEHAIAIDGDLADWASVPELSAKCPSCFCPACTPGQAYTVRSTPTADGQVALLVDTGGAPMAGAFAYSVGLSPLDGPQYALTFQLFAGGTPVITLGDVAITGLPVEVAYGATGIELAIPVDALPFGGGFVANAALERKQLGKWEFAQQVVPTIAACWDPSASICLPK
jgi:hypothetical protein